MPFGLCVPDAFSFGNFADTGEPAPPAASQFLQTTKDSLVKMHLLSKPAHPMPAPQPPPSSDSNTPGFN